MANKRTSYTQASSLLAPNLAQFAIINQVGEDRMAFYDSSQGTWTNLKANKNLEIVATNLNVSFASAGFVTNGLIYWNGTDLVNSANLTFDGIVMTVAGSGVTSTLRVGYLEEQSVSVNNVMLHNNGYYDGVTGFRYRANGYYNLIQYTAGGWAFITGPSGTAGNLVSYTPVLTIANTTGDAVFLGNVTGAKFIGPATALKSVTTSIDVASATAPTSGQILTATSGSAATWQTPAGGTVITSGSPVSGQTAEFTSSTAITGVSVTGTGNYVKATSPTLVTPILGTPTSGTLTSCTGLPLTTGVTGILPLANGGTNASSFGTANGLVYYDGTRLVNDSDATFDGTTMYINVSTTVLPLLRAGLTEIQTYSSTQSAIFHNGYFDGANFKYRTTGAYFSGIQFLSGGLQVVGTAGSGTAGGNVTYTIPMTLSSAGDAVFTGGVTGTLFTGPVTALKSASTSVSISAATAPSSGQVLTATSSTAATWQTPFLKAYLTANFSKTNNTLSNVTDLTLTLTAGHIYKVSFVGIVENTVVQSQMDFNGGSATVTGTPTGVLQLNDNDSNTVSCVSLTALNTVISGGTAGALSTFTAEFTVAINAGGTLIPRFAQVTTNASANFLYKYATITAVDIT